MSISKFTSSFNSSQPMSIGLATVSGTTGAPTVDTSSRAGKTIYKFTGSGTITIAKAGYAEVLIVAGGGGGNSGTSNTSNGGAGGYIYKSSAYLPSGTFTVTVGSGGSGANNGFTASGTHSSIADFYAFGGGAGGWYNADYGSSGKNGGSGGSSGSSGGADGLGVAGQGYPSGAGYYYPSGGGGAGGPGGSGASAPGTAGPGVSNSITGTSVTYGTGGTRGAGNGATNTGSGGGGLTSNSTASAGGSGIVVVVIG